MAEEWYVGSNGQQSGPFTLQQLRQMAASGQLSKTDLIWKQGLASWVACSSVKGLFPAVADFSPTLLRPAPRPTAPPPRGPVPSEGDLVVSEVTGGVDPLSTVQLTHITETITGAPFQLAEFLPRVGATLLDGLFVGLITCIPSVILIGILVAANANNLQDDFGQNVQGNAEAVGLTINICSSLIQLVVGAIYYVTLDSSAKQGTWGKQIVGLKVTDLEGRRISVGRAIGRYFARFLSYCTCSIGFLLPLFTQKRQTLHDLICGCIVVNK
jgi:uncharacterized RDD family membrane protein YckC